ncbi:thiamine pyrophosphate-dependent enzyme [Aureibaculum sp. 2210JD6-5]|uniref:alpha-ketoacid dehydrogenase subunit alpha/beta n=1 Tax=Aureibaculum sp. 2210JD6-5 TaxID=3103957 RepID=UPI002AAEFE25|nr:thiamine pyrophosphate-dependent enzyme [Aureibaculum sp. 2210JD6-5]MDY7395499.1 thiamine pyrophosphate-dependent enzyme [Aureibaculum sp. 2210JD6-5]
MSEKTITSEHKLSFEEFKKEILEDYKIAVISRECSLLGRREVLTGKAKFGIFGDGKEVPQLAMAKAFKNGDWRSGYYRDQTFMMAIGELTPEQFFAGLYAHTDIVAEPYSAGRQMGGHFTTHTLNEDGSWKNHMQQKNISADISPTAGQMPRLLGLAQASKMYREIPELKKSETFSDNGNEIAWGTIGNASTSEGHFFETINAAGVLQVPMVISVWDDEYGISVHAKHQTTKESISEILKGFQRTDDEDGYEIFVVNGWDYSKLIDVYTEASTIARKNHVPVLIHVKELTQPQGHSTSGSHERYKTPERLEWEAAHDCNAKMKEWIIEVFENEEELIAIEKTAKRDVSAAKRAAWAAYLQDIIKAQKEVVGLLDNLANQSENKPFILKLKKDLEIIKDPLKKDVLSTARKCLVYVRNENSRAKETLINWIKNYDKEQHLNYSTHLYSENENSATTVKEIKPVYTKDAETVDARIVLRDNFDALLSQHNALLIFGEDAGKIGDVNQGLEGLQQKYGKLRVADTGIREASIMGQGIGMAMRGLRPIAEIQYLDYLLYGLQILSDDLATLRYRTFGRQKAPLIVRTRGHRLEGIWHSGSHMGAVIHLLRGVYILTPRNMTKAAGFYNTLLKSDEPALIVENLNGYRLKEALPTNLGQFTTPIGVVEIIKEGKDVTVVSYGSTLKLVEEASKELLKAEIDIEIIDAQTLLPFDIDYQVIKSIEKTNRLVIIDEDVPGGASAYLLDQIINKQNAYQFLDSKPLTITAKDHRPAYGTDGDYFSKPSIEDIFEGIYNVMNEANPSKYKKLY